ncbi:hypothetical protein CEUSTIGMA_g2224.t1 [Chlamydomonas eustigma]|uniref:Glycosyltransferase subfamily 4-like N-terminal domain-containing protein n=1 Tax=Chlamydomonas eustigma TaxID=1157962 RepID=A0A250WVC0_9CHLO|nr:hypothetical protein CEUSTIGMA_g2224.t1 [Chlamydomonas eustigma]|eukprot:GAX74777.1 hypothetical protein CEUSTIGMA_g2224.t1 [Chlamydomonas eustigma]
MKKSSTLITWVVVLGDFGRSPRMQYHTESLSNKPNSVVYVIAYGGATPLKSLKEARNVHINTLHEVPKIITKLPGVLKLIFKVLHQLTCMMWLMLIQLPAPTNILMQNPPAIPTMVLCWLAARRHGASLVIDWHNFGHSIMALKHSPTSTIVRLARNHEAAWGRMADKSFCVTCAMKDELSNPRWRISATVLYDRPPHRFCQTDVHTAHTLFVKLAAALSGSESECVAHTCELQPCTDFASSQASSWSSTMTIATTCSSTNQKSNQAATVDWRSDRPAVVVSSTSWTPDEDFGILLEALILYEQDMQAQIEELTGIGFSTEAGRGPSRSKQDGRESATLRLPPLLVLITGRGPLREMYLEKVSQLQLKHVAVRSLWLEADDYPLLLGAADLGVSLHASSSGLDLPMKVVDMFGAGLPVCALSYNCIHELVEAGETGLLFTNPGELCQQLQQLLSGFPTAPSKQLMHLQKQVRDKEQGLRWDVNWDRVAWPLLCQKKGTSSS